MKEEKVIRYEGNYNISKDDGKTFEDLKRKNVGQNILQGQNNNINVDNNNKKKCIWKYIFFQIIGILIIGAIVITIVLLTKKRPPIDTTTIPIIGNSTNSGNSDLGPLEMQTEYKINTNKNDLKRIYINQRYYEDINIEGVLTKNIVDRKTNYDIYIISEIESNEETKNFYNKTYFCSISIASECLSTKDEYCLPKKLVDLNDQDYSHVRVLDEVNDFENFPLPLCFFNLTDNNVITSIACHKNISESRVNSIVLDLYFFRPPGIKRIKTEEGNITIITYKEGDKDVVRETNGGICNVEKSIGSFCTTDMITKKDSKGNLLTYDEVAFTNLTTNENNYYIKNKTTTLIDKTEFITNLNPQKYNKTLFLLYPKLSECLKYYEKFSTEEFKELYNVTKGIETESQKARRRNLHVDRPVIMNNEKLFDYSHYCGIEISLMLQDNSGYNTEAMEAASFFEIDGQKKNLANIKEFSDIDKAISKLISLSRAGNNLETALYEKIKDKLYNITEVINIYIPSMNNLVLYKELTDIFDSTFSLNSLKIIPKEIIKESDNLIKNLDDLYNNIDNGSLKNNIIILNNYIYNFIKQSHKLVNNVSKKLEELFNLIKSSKQAISQISYYYMNHTSTSYVNTIIEAKNILMNYYINEKDLIIPKVDKILKDFEQIVKESIQKQVNLVNNLNSKFENNNLTIKDANEEDYKKIITNLDNSNKYINNIIVLFKNKVEKEIDLKNGYFISKYDIEQNSEIFNRTIEESLKIANNLDNNEYIDKTFDKIMTDFRNKFTSITKYMEEIKEEQFPLDEDTLRSEYFKFSEQQKISKELKEDLGVEIINKIKNENNEYLEKIKEIIDIFLKNNKQNLDKIINELIELFSEVNLIKMDNSYEESFNGYFKIVSDKIKQNKEVTYIYFNDLVGLMKNNTKVKESLKKTPVNKALPPEIGCEYPTHEECWKYDYFIESITGQYITQYYVNKYIIIKEVFDNTKEFINGELYSNILQEYKKRINSIKEALQTFKNNRISDKYPELNDLYFIDNHLKTLETFYYNLNKYISDDRFNKYYLPKFNNFKSEKNNEIDKIKDFIEDNHKNLTAGKIKIDFKNDYCKSYLRKKVYTCNNGAHYYYDDSGEFCFESNYPENYKNITKSTFTADINYQNEFKNFYDSIKNKIDTYNKIINSLKKSLNDAESTILNKKITKDYLVPIQEKINSILYEKYSNKLIKASYDYYKNLLDLRLENMLKNISDKWSNSFNNLEENINKNLDNFKSSIMEFGLVASIYNSIISQNLTRIFYDSIITHQRSEFNYTISYYYNCLIQNITSVYQFIYNQIPTNQEGLNNIINLRKEELNKKFNSIIKTIKESKEESLNFNHQANALQVSPSNFFNKDSILAKINKDTKTVLDYKALEIQKIKNNKQHTELSLACRFYLENSLNGWQIEDYYEPINENIFVELKLDKFRKLLSNNWIFDQNDFVNKLNLSLYNINLDIKNDFFIKKEEYRQDLEKKITEFYSKESIVSKINNQYNSQIKVINDNIVKDIKLYIQNILNKIKNNLIAEEKRLEKEAVSYSKDLKTINKTIQNLKNEIINKLINSLHEIVNNFTKNMINRAYKERIEKGLDEYLISAENFSSTCETFDTLKSSFNIGNITLEIVSDLVEEYKNFTLIQIRLKNDIYIEKIEKEAKIDEIKKLINNEIDSEYANLLEIIKNVSVDNVGNDDYDLTEIKIDENMKNINNTINKIKGNKYYVDLYDWQILNYDFVNSFSQIEVSFKNFILNKKYIEKILINTFLKDIIRNNFNILINNLYDHFGNEFFSRIIKYNIFFKISTLYQDLKYSLVVSLMYYASLYNLRRSINSLTQDLKIKLYNLNNLDLIAKEKNEKVLKLLNHNIDEFIEKSVQYLVNDYKKFLIEDSYIKINFNEKILNSIDTNLKDVSSELEKDFTNLLNEKFKNNFINSYIKVMNTQTADMIDTVNNLKQNIKSMIDGLFSLDIDKVLNDTNNKMNETLNSIKEYNNHFNSFKIPEELIKFLDTYGDNVIQRAYDGFETLINKETKNITLTNLQKNSKKFEDYLKSDDFMKIRNNTYSLLKNENIDIIKQSINTYGTTEYPNILQNEINRIDSRILRRLNGEQTEDDTVEEYKEKVADKAIDENFNKLLNISESTLNFIKTYENFDKFEEIIQKYKKKLKISYKESQQIIENTYKDDDIFEILNDKLESLNNYSQNYYDEIENYFNSLKKYIEESLNEIDDLLNQCANVTFKTFANKYEEISKDAESIDKQYDNKVNLEPITHISSFQNGEFNTTAEISNLKRKARFKFELITEGEGRVKKPKIRAIVNNQIRPENVILKISSKIGSCGEEYNLININFNNVTYSTYLNFDTKSTLINVTTISDFESFKYSIGRYKIENSDENFCTCFLGICNCIENSCDINNILTIEEPIEKTKHKIYKEDSISIEG